MTETTNAVNESPKRAIVDSNVLIAHVNPSDSLHKTALALIEMAAQTKIEVVYFDCGQLNFNDALIVVACRELGIDTILSFDADFDTLPDLIRLK